jgi:predicted transcriptional regulator
VSAKVNAKVFERFEAGADGLRLTELYEMARKLGRISLNRARSLVEIACSVGFGTVTPSEFDGRVKNYSITPLGQEVIRRFVEARLLFVDSLNTGERSQIRLELQLGVLARYLLAEVDCYTAVGALSDVFPRFAAVLDKTGGPETLHLLAGLCQTRGRLRTIMPYSAQYVAKALSISRVQVIHIVDELYSEGLISNPEGIPGSVELTEKFFDLCKDIRALEAAIILTSQELSGASLVQPDNTPGAT